MKKEEIKPFAWGVAAGAIGLPIALFWAGWVVSSGSARESAVQMSERAVLESLTPICMAQFPQDATRVTLLKELKGVDSWKRGDFIKDKGWATMPGSKAADSNVARECADRLALLDK